MKRTLFASLALSLLPGVSAPFASAPRFEKVSEHFYCLHPKDDDPNVGAVVTPGSVLLINPRANPGRSEMLEALKRVTAKPVDWVVNTDGLYDRGDAGAFFSRQGAVVLASKEQQQLALSAPMKGAGDETAVRQDSKTSGSSEPDIGATPRFVFSRQMRVFPDGVEVRIAAVPHKAHTAGDVVVFLPAEKVLVVGDLFVSGCYPEIDRAGGNGSALGWLEGFKQVIDMVPLLKSAMPQPKPDPSKPPPEEKTLEELVTVIPGRGPRSNLQEMKLLLEVAQKLRAEVARAVSAGRSRENVLASPALNPYRNYKNFEMFAGLLFDELLDQRPK